MRRYALVFAFLASCAGCAAPPEVVRQALGTFQSDTFGGRSYKWYVPSGGGTSRPLVLMLHGCSQDPDQFATATRMNEVAEANGFVALYPDQPTSAQPLKCWTWYDAAHQQRGQGEPAALVALVDHLIAGGGIDASRVYVAGLSAGAAMAVILGAAYPDRFRALAVAAGLEYAAATSASAASGASANGGPDPAQQGRAASQAAGGAKQAVRVIVFHGADDATVAPVNGDQVVAQWVTTDDLADGVEDGNVSAQPDEVEHGQVPGGRTWTRAHHRDHSTGMDAVVKVTIDGMGHAWPGGADGASFTDALAPDASGLAWAFFASRPLDLPDGGASDGATTGGADAATEPAAPAGGCSMGGRPAPALPGLLLLLLLTGRLRPRAYNHP